MKKCLLLIALLVLSKWNILCAQTLFNAPDTVCINQPVTLTSNIFNQASYYWGFCSGYLMNAPTGTNLGDNFGFNLPANIDIAYDSGLYYGFVVNSGDSQLIRLDFGNSLSNTPTIFNYGNLTFGLPANPTSLFIVHDTAGSGNWYIFVSGGWTTATSSLGRVDFGKHLGNLHPNVANFGNYHNTLKGPKGIFVAQDTNKHWYGYLVNHNSSTLVHLDFGTDVSLTPHVADQGNVFATLNSPTDMAGIRYGGKWYLFVTNEGNNTISRVNLGTGLDTVSPGGTALGSFDFRINAPSSLSINADCGNTYLYVTDSTTSQLVSIQMPDVSDETTYNAVDYSVVGGMNFPAGISSILRDHDDLYGFVVNAKDSSLTRLDFSPCHDATIPSFSEVAPPIYSYNTPGLYNIYYVINQGLPTMQVECKEIRVLAYPPIYMNRDTTICQGDTIHAYVVSSQADSIRWTSTYAIDTTFMFQDSVRIFPQYNTKYPVVLYYPDGCIVDTALRVNVVKVKADAGPDRWIKDGASTILGGPNTTTDDVFTNTYYSFYWSPYQYLSDTLSPNPVANPPRDMTYYLTVTDSAHCVSMDTVVFHNTFGYFYLPNAFAPNSENAATNHFRILNMEIAQLSYLRVFNRWGAMVYETSDPTQGWDGTYNGKPCPSDVYVWEADGFCQSSGKEYKKKGNVTLMR